MVTPAKRLDLRFYLTREPVLLAILAGLAVVLFLAVTALSRIYHAQQASLGNRWFTRGVADLKAKRFNNAVADFHTALLYSRDNYSYRLNLAEALLGLNRPDEAYAYLINLWERQPEEGLVNLELARIAAARGQKEQALRYYHNAIYATWPDNPDNEKTERRETRVELIEYLLKIGEKEPAQAELIALAANLGDDPAEQDRVGELFLRAQDYEHALSAFRLSLKSDRKNPAAIKGAATAAFELGRYPLAQHYLEESVAADPSDAESTERLKTTELVLRMDPFQRQISAAQRNRIVVEAFAAAGARLKSCATIGSSASASQQNLAQDWARMKAGITEHGLARDPDLVNTAMELVFHIERQTSATCGSPTDMDMALLMIAKLHEGI